MSTTAVVLCSAAVLVEIIFVPLYLKKMWPTKNLHSLVYKMVCATVYVFIASVCAIQTNPAGRYAIFMLIAFVFSWLGDLLLHIPKPTRRYFLIGTAMFATAHIFYCCGYIVIQQQFFPGGPAFYLQEIAAAVLLTAAMLIVTYSTGTKLGALFLPMAVYGCFVSTMTIKSTELAISLLLNADSSFYLPSLLLIFGGICFAASDFTLGLISFDTRHKKFRLKVFNSVTYFLAQVCLAFTVYFFN